MEQNDLDQQLKNAKKVGAIQASIFIGIPVLIALGWAGASAWLSNHAQQTPSQTPIAIAANPTPDHTILGNRITARSACKGLVFKALGNSARISLPTVDLTPIPGKPNHYIWKAQVTTPNGNTTLAECTITGNDIRTAQPQINFQ